MIQIISETGKIPIQSGTLCYAFNTVPVLQIVLPIQTYLALSTGMQLFVQSKSLTIDHPWIITEIIFENAQQTVYAHHPLYALQMDYGYRIFYDTNAQEILEHFLLRYHLKAQFSNKKTELLEKKPIVLKQPNDSGLNFFNWLCALHQYYWFCQTEQFTIRLVDITSLPSIEWHLEIHAHHYFLSNTSRSQRGAIIAIEQDNQSPYPIFTIQSNEILLYLGDCVEIRYQNQDFLGRVSQISVGLAEFKFDYKISPVCLAQLPLYETVTDLLLEGIAIGNNAPLLTEHGQPTIRLLLGQAETEKTHAAIDSITYFSHPNSAIQAPPVASQPVLVLSQKNKTGHYLMGGFYHCQAPNPITPESTRAGAMIFPLRYGLQVENKDQFIIQDRQNAMALTLSLQPDPVFQLCNPTNEISFMSEHYQCQVKKEAHYISTKSCWKADTIYHQADEYHHDYQTLSMQCKKYYESGRTHCYQSGLAFHFKSNQFNSQQSSLNALASQALLLQAHKAHIKATQTICIQFPGGIVTLSPHHITLSATKIDFSKTLLQIRGRIHFGANISTIKLEPLFTISEQSRYDEKDDRIKDLFSNYINKNK